ncbi:MAG: secretin N-terminal domain-containing protein [Pirellulaceae bacterium]
MIKYPTKLFVMVAAMSFCTIAAAQPPAPDDPMVKLDASGEMELRSLVEYVAERMGLRFTYDSTLLQKKVNIIVPDPVPTSSLLDILQSVLRTEGFVIADAGVPGWKRIVPIERIPEVANPSDDQTSLADMGAAEPVTRVFRLKNSVATKIAELVLRTMSKSGSSIVPVDNQRILIVTDVVENVRRVAQLIELLDTGKPLVEVRFVAAKNVKAEALAEQLSALLISRAKALGRKEDEGTGIEVSVDARTNQLILIGNVGDIAQAEDLLKQLDSELPTSARTILLQFTSPEQLDEILRGMIEGRTVRPPYQSRIEGRALVIDSTPDVLRLAEQIRNQIDTREAPADQSPIRFYKVKNVPAQELLQTIQSIFTGTVQPTRRGLPERRRTSADGLVSGPNYPPIFGGQFASPYVPIPQTPAMRLPGQGVDALGNPTAVDVNNSLEQFGSAQSPSSPTSFSSELIGEAQVTVDIHTNTIIVVAKPEVQRIYASLIEQLDERRPQVLIEAKVVIIDTSNDYTLGVEVSGGDRTGDKKAFAFTSYGFSAVDPVNGALQIVPGVGFNGTLVDPSTADVVVRALSTHRRARVLSSPRILVNDNAEGELTSVLEIPFTSVNASQTVATTSFAGFAEAGTTITVTPTISDDNYLQMDYIMTLNTFTGDGADGVPPPRQTNEVRSRVTVPDGYTVIVGGLTSKSDVMSYRGLPWLEKIPIVRDLTGTTSTSGDQTSLFVFLRPVILRDDKFKDLKYVSDAELRDACLPGEYPPSRSLSIP